MLKTLQLLFTCLFLVSQLMADPVDPVKARKAGETFLKYWIQQKPADFQVQLTLRETATASLPASGENINTWYLFSNISGGFVLVSADDRVQPVLGYATKGTLPSGPMPDHVLSYLSLYKMEITDIIEQRIEPTQEVASQWIRLLNDLGPENDISSVLTVNPLIATKWDQSPYYNALAPFDNTYNQQTVAGCVATAMAMILKYHNYPSNGTGFHSYNHQKYGVQSANFGATTYNYAQMPNSVNSPNQSVATLMYHCGVSVDMDFGVGQTGGSSAYVLIDKSPIQHCAQYAFLNYFGYKTSMQGVQRVNYTQTNWINLLKSELDASRPVYYAGFGSGGGHAFLCDGYDANDFFHFNWGWSGNFDGYFSINALNPSGVGTGGGSGGFNAGHQAIVGLEPKTQSDPNPGPQSYKMALYDNLYSSNNPLQYGSAFSITTNVVNLGSNNFVGDYAAAIFDEDLNYIDMVEVKTGWSLGAGNTYSNNITFSNSGLFSMVPGTYYIAIFYRPNGGDWVIFADNGSYQNILTQYVVFANAIEMYSEMITTPAPDFISGNSASVNLNLLNNDISTFYGDYAVNLYDLDGSFVETINVITESGGLPSGYVYSHPYLTFTTPKLNADPGTYLLAVLFKPSFSSSWSLVGSSDYKNPIRVIVTSPAIQPDQYEPNNTVNQPYVLPVTFTNNSVKIVTNNANLHQGSDLDFYRINLSSGYNYSIQARLHDSWDSGDGNTYTLDGLFSYTTNAGNSWSDAYDDVMDGSFNMNQGGNLVFQVAPFFVGETGTYSLEINITRGSVSIDEPAEMAGFTLFPNPVRDMLYLDMDGYQGLIHRFELIHSDGRITPINAFPGLSGIRQIPVDGLAPGNYFLRITADHGTITRKITIQ